VSVVVFSILEQDRLPAKQSGSYDVAATGVLYFKFVGLTGRASMLEDGVITPVDTRVSVNISTVRCWCTYVCYNALL